MEFETEFIGCGLICSSRNYGTILKIIWRRKMRKIDGTSQKEKRVLTANQNPFNENQFESLGGNSNKFFILNYAEKDQKLQCQLCGEITTGATLCPDCEAEQNRRRTEIVNLFTTPPKIIKLTARCFSCNRAMTAARMASGRIICRTCAGELKTKGATARNNFVEKVKANVGRFLKEVSAI